MSSLLLNLLLANLVKVCSGCFLSWCSGLLAVESLLGFTHNPWFSIAGGSDVLEDSQGGEVCFWDLVEQLWDLVMLV